MAAASPVLVLKVQDAPGAKPRTISSFGVAAGDVALLSTILEPHVPSDPVRILLIKGFYRGHVPDVAAVAQHPTLELVATDASRVAEWNRLASYLVHGVEGKSAPKAGQIVSSDARTTALVLPPPSAPSPTAASAAPLALSFWRPPQPSQQNSHPHSLTALPAAAGGSATGGAAGRTTDRSTPAPAAPPPAVAGPPSTVRLRPYTPRDELAEAHVPRGEKAYSQRGRVYVSVEQVRDAAAGGSLGRLKADFTSRVVAGEVPFPYKRACIPEAQVREWFALLRRYHSGVRLEFGDYPLHGYYPGRPGVFEASVCAPLRVALEGGPLPSGTLVVDVPGPSRAVLDGAAAKDLAGCGPALLPFEHAFNELGSALVDYFSEPARMAAVRKDEGAPPLELWRREDVARFAVDKAVRKYGELSEFSLRHGLYGKVAGCNLFKCHLASAIYTLLGGTRILDPCAGWGDRLLGAMGTPAVRRYLAFDPNPALVPCHGGMIRAFAAIAGGSYAVVPLPFEEGVVPPPAVAAVAGADGGDAAGAAAPAAGPDFDLVMTSPPYYDLELYEDEVRKGAVKPAQAQAAHGEGTGVGASAGAGAAAAASGAGASSSGAAVTSKQSTVTHPSLEEWLREWYFPMMQKAWLQLRPGGHLAFYINDHAGKEAPDGSGRKEGQILMCLPMLQYAGTHLPDCVWVGTLGIQGETGAVRPLWVWRKGTALLPNAAGEVAPLYAMLAQNKLQPTASSRSSSAGVVGF